MPVTITIVPTGEIDGDQIDRMWALYQPFHVIEREEFIERAHWGIDRVALYEDARTGALVGFTGLRVQRFRLPAGSAGTIYVGLTFIERAYRGHNLIQRTVIRTMLPARIASPREPLFFWSDCISYKPYLLAARNLHRFYPSPDWSTPALVEQLIDAIGGACYSGSYVPGQGIVRKPARRVIDETTVITPKDMRDRHIRFYATKNPGHARGDGMIAIFPITAANFAHFVVRQTHKRLSGTVFARLVGSGAEVRS